MGNLLYVRYSLLNTFQDEAYVSLSWPKLSGIQICIAPEQAFSSSRHLSASLLQWTWSCKSCKGMSWVWSALQLRILLHVKNWEATGSSLPGAVIQLQYTGGIKLKQPLQNIPREGSQGDENKSPTTGLVQAFLLLQYSQGFTYWTSKVWRL